jgi:Domain of unknown function (DUF4062)
MSLSDAPRPPKIFLSGTNSDLLAYKEAALKVFGRLHFTYNVQQDRYQTGQNTNALAWSENLMAGTDWYVVIVGRRYGTLVTDPESGEKVSVTEMEYRYALKTNMRCFALLTDEDNFSDAQVLREVDKLPSGGQDFERTARLEKFRETLKKDNTVRNFFQNVDNFVIILERMLHDAWQTEKDEWIKKHEIEITESFNQLLAKRGDFRRRVLRLDDRFKLNQVRLNAVTCLKRMHDGIHIARQDAIRPLRELTLPEWERGNKDATIVTQLKAARRVLRDLAKLRAFFESFETSVVHLVTACEQFSESRANLNDAVNGFFDCLVFADSVADYDDPKALKNDLKSFVDTLEATFGLLSSELKAGADTLLAKNKEIENDVNGVLQDPNLGLSEQDRNVVRNRMQLLRVRSEDMHIAIHGHDDWQWVHDRLNLIDQSEGGDGYAREITKDLCGNGRVGKQLLSLVVGRRRQLSERVMQQLLAPDNGAQSYQTRTLNIWRQRPTISRALRSTRSLLAQKRLEGNRSPMETLYLRRRKCITLFGKLSSLRAVTMGAGGARGDVAGAYGFLRVEFDDQFYYVDQELGVLCTELSKKVDESLAALREIDLKPG